MQLLTISLFFLTSCSDLNTSPKRIRSSDTRLALAANGVKRSHLNNFTFTRKLCEIMKGCDVNVVSWNYRRRWREWRHASHPSTSQTGARLSSHVMWADVNDGRHPAQVTWRKYTTQHWKSEKRLLPSVSCKCQASRVTGTGRRGPTQDAGPPPAIMMRRKALRMWRYASIIRANFSS